MPHLLRLDSIKNCLKINKATTPSQKRWLLILICLLVLGGCTWKMAYNYSDYLLLWKINTMFDLDGNQYDFVSDRLEYHLKWHRKSELPKYRQSLIEVRNRVEQGLKRKDIDWLIQTLQQLQTDLVRELASDTSHFFTQLTPAQIDQFEQDLQKQQDEFQQQLTLSINERRDQRAVNTVNLLSALVGELTESQQKQVYQWVFELPDHTEELIQLRSEQHKQFLAKLRDQVSAHAFEEYLLSLFDPRNVSESEKQLAFRNQLQDVLLKIDAMLTAEQREHLVNLLDDLIEDLEDLIDD